MSAAALLAEADAGGFRPVLAAGGRLRVPASAPPDLLARLREPKPELIAILSGGVCRRCGEPMGWPAPVGVVFGDGTALHHACRAADDLARVRSALAPVRDEVELTIRGESLP